MSKADDQFPLSAMIKAGFNRDPLVLDIAEIIECRALQDLKWRARVKLDNGVFLIGWSCININAESKVLRMRRDFSNRTRCSANTKRTMIPSQRLSMGNVLSVELQPVRFLFGSKDLADYQCIQVCDCHTRC